MVVISQINQYLVDYKYTYLLLFFIRLLLLLIRLTAMLNRNPGVYFGAEPLSTLPPDSSAELQLQTILNSVNKLENNSEATIIGFNEKLLTKRYKLASDDFNFEKLRQYLHQKNFKYCDLISILVFLVFIKLRYSLLILLFVILIFVFFFINTELFYSFAKTSFFKLYQ